MVGFNLCCFFLTFKGEYNCFSSGIESWDGLYAVTCLRNDLEVSFCYTSKLANEFMLCGNKSMTSALQFENFAMEDIINGVIMSLGIAEKSIFDILEVSNEFALVSIFKILGRK